MTDCFAWRKLSGNRNQEFSGSRKVIRTLSSFTLLLKIIIEDTRKIKLEDGSKTKMQLEMLVGSFFE